MGVTIAYQLIIICACLEKNKSRNSFNAVKLPKKKNFSIFNKLKKEKRF